MTTRGNQSRSGDKCRGWARGWGSREATGKDSPKGWTISEGSKTSVGAKGVSTLGDKNSIPETPMLPWLWSFIKDRYICTHMCACVHSFLLPLPPFLSPPPVSSFHNGSTLYWQVSWERGLIGTFWRGCCNLYQNVYCFWTPLPHMQPWPERVSVVEPLIQL